LPRRQPHEPLEPWQPASPEPACPPSASRVGVSWCARQLLTGPGAHASPAPVRSSSQSQPERPWQQASSPRGEEPRDAKQQLHDPIPRVRPMPSCLTPLVLHMSRSARRVNAARTSSLACASRSEGSVPGHNKHGCAPRLPSHTCRNIASQRRYVMGDGTRADAKPPRAGTLPLEGLHCPLDQ
jgi:hypothetical protein